MGLIVRFASSGAKAAFLERLRAEAPQLQEGARVSKSDPCTLTLTYGSAGAEKLIREMLGPDSRAFDDIQMRTF